MIEQEIIEGNKLIAEFMEYKHSDILYDEENEEYFFDTDHLVCVEDIEVWESSVDDWTSTLSPEQMLFHSSWDWLMPCIGKISNVCEEPEELDGLKYALLTNNIEEAWEFVVNYLTIS